MRYCSLCIHTNGVNMLKVYNVVASGGEWEDSYHYIVASFTKEEHAQKYLESHCTLQGQEMQAKHGAEGHNYLWWKNEAKSDDYDTESWSIEELTVYESLEEENEDD